MLQRCEWPWAGEDAVHLELTNFRFNFRWKAREAFVDAFDFALTRERALPQLFLRNVSPTVKRVLPGSERDGLYWSSRFGPRKSSVVIRDAGWHCSFCMPAARIAQKLETYSHADRVADMSLHRIERAMCRGVDLAPGNVVWIDKATAVSRDARAQFLPSALANAPAFLWPGDDDMCLLDQ